MCLESKIGVNLLLKGLLNIPWQEKYRLVGKQQGKMDLSISIYLSIYMYIQFNGPKSSSHTKNCPHQKQCKARNANYQGKFLILLFFIIQVGHG